jgi:hypothetical protein
MQRTLSNEWLTLRGHGIFFKTRNNTANSADVGGAQLPETLLDSLIKLPYVLRKSPCLMGRYRYFFRKLAKKSS